MGVGQLVAQRLLDRLGDGVGANVVAQGVDEPPARFAPCGLRRLNQRLAEGSICSRVMYTLKLADPPSPVPNSMWSGATSMEASLMVMPGRCRCSCGPPDTANALERCRQGLQGLLRRILKSRGQHHHGVGRHLDVAEVRSRSLGEVLMPKIGCSSVSLCRT